MGYHAQKCKCAHSVQILMQHSDSLLFGLRSGNSSRYKTELCRAIEEYGTCRYGKKCQFAHCLAERRYRRRHPKYKTEPGRSFHMEGFCQFGKRCYFVHTQKDESAIMLLITWHTCCTPLPSNYALLHVAGRQPPSTPNQF